MGLIEGLLENFISKKDFQYKVYFDDGIDFDKDLVKEFVNYCLDYLKIKDESQNLMIVFSNEKEKFDTYAYYDLNSKIAAVYCGNRAILDIFRSLAHELVHHKQNIKNEIDSKQTSEGNDGVPIENEANAVAGIIMRVFGRNHKELY